jgi:hypothetical protein
MWRSSDLRARGGVPAEFAMRTSAAERRVRRLLNAISDLHEGDLVAVLELTAVTPIIDFSDDDAFKLEDDGTISFIPTPGPRPKSLKHRVATGEQLGRILERQLIEVMALGEAILPSHRKSKRKWALGGRVWSE